MGRGRERGRACVDGGSARVYLSSVLPSRGLGYGRVRMGRARRCVFSTDGKPASQSRPGVAVVRGDVVGGSRRLRVSAEIARVCRSALAYEPAAAPRDVSRTHGSCCGMEWDVKPETRQPQNG